jgi:hypothetical protein
VLFASVSLINIDGWLVVLFVGDMEAELGSSVETAVVEGAMVSVAEGDGAIEG